MKRPLILLPLLAFAAGCRTVALDEAKLFPEPFSDLRLGMPRERFAEIRPNAVWPVSESDMPIATETFERGSFGSSWCKFKRNRDGSTELVEVRLYSVRGNKGREASSAEDVLAETIARLGEPSSRKTVWRIGIEFDTHIWIDGRTVVLFERELSFDGVPSNGEPWCYSVASRKTFDEKESYSRNLLDPAFEATAERPLFYFPDLPAASEVVIFDMAIGSRRSRKGEFPDFDRGLGEALLAQLDGFRDFEILVGRGAGFYDAIGSWPRQFWLRTADDRDNATPLRYRYPPSDFAIAKDASVLFSLHRGCIPHVGYVIPESRRSAILSLLSAIETPSSTQSPAEESHAENAEPEPHAETSERAE